ncbi:MAG: AraC family transcriptional regulator [Proteobacteria bacterium]|nr:AraC family transcriptional regulator [Pseudomonadota bacterium]
MSSLQLREGFAGQDMFVIPRPILARARQHPLVKSVYPTDIGWFPSAAHHFRDRPQGARQDHLMLCVGGHGYAVIDGRETQLRQGELLVIPRETRHTYWAADDDPWSIYWVHFLGEDADYYVERIPRRGNAVPVAPDARKEAVRLFRYCLDALYEGYGQKTLIYAAQSVQHILSLLLYRNHALPTEQRRKDWRSDLESIIEYMHAHLNEPLRLEDFASEAGLSVSHFSELFRSQTGQSPMAYFIHLRMRLACRLLDLSHKPIKVVAIETGYRDPYYFSRVFKKAMGISPEKYREIKKG